MIPRPHLIPGFELLERLASGGAAAVFRSRREVDGLEVALKITSLQDLDPDFHPVERFHREGALLERLNHASLPRFLGYGVTPDDLGWIAMELVHGRPLTDFSRRPLAELLPIFIQVAEGLQAVAQEGIVHRDISPDNILVEDRHGRWQARLIDFGIAKDLLAGEEAGALTQHGAFLGKLAYASPEQLIGLPEGETIDFRSDVYSLGLTFHEILTGRRAIEEDSFPSVVDAHLKGDLSPLTIPPELGGPAPRLVSLVSRMTRKAREDRPASWEEVLAELWRSREEATPLSEALSKKRGEGPPSDTAVPQAQGGAGRPLPVPPPSIARALSRELLLGRLVLALGAAAFLASVLFAIHSIRFHRQILHVPPPTVPAEQTLPREKNPARSPVPIPTSEAPRATPRPAMPRPATPRPATTRTSRPAPTPARQGTLEISLLPEGDLEEIRNASGQGFPARHLPARLLLPPGDYELHLSASRLDCKKTISVTVRAGRTTTVRESCIEVK